MKNLTIAILLLAISFSACKKDDPIPPTADFSYSLKGAFSPCKVEFATASEADSYQWTINGTTIVSNDQNPAIAFNSPGTYEVTLSVTSVGGTTESTQSVVIPATASTMKINSVTLTGYPLLKNGEKWDLYPVSGPDISFQFYGPSPIKPLLYIHDNMFEDRELVQDLKFQLPADTRFTLQQEGYHLLVVDNDNAGYADIMGEISFNPWETILSTKTYPGSFTVTQNGITAVLEITWL